MAEETLIDKIEEGLSEYYREQGVEYCDENGVGKFKKWVDDV